MEKTKRGLMKPSIFQIILSDMTVIPRLRTRMHHPDPWGFDKLWGLFEQLMSLQATSKKLCLFLDGLDVLEGDFEDLLEIIRRFENYQNLKICCASRNEQVFAEKFGGPLDAIIVEEHTKKDIEKYIFEKLSKSPSFNSCIEKDIRCKSVVPRIRQLAQGIWLWVYFVVADLRRDIEANESFEIMMRRVNDLPLGLEGFYARMLLKLDPFHRKETSRLLVILDSFYTALPTIAARCIGKEIESPDYAIQKAVRDIGTREYYRKWTTKPPRLPRPGKDCI
jgi:hypothetical protein